MSENFDNELPKELIEIERALCALAPVPAQLDRDRLLFEAGIARGLAVAAPAPTVAADAAFHDPMVQEDQAKLQIRSRRAVIPWQRRGTRRWMRMGSVRSWRLATAAATLVACCFASLFVAQRNRPPVVIRQIVTAARPQPPAGSQVVSTDKTEQRAVNSGPSTSYSAPGTPYSGLGASFWPLSGFLSLATSHPTNYLTLRQIVLTRGVDALPQSDTIGDTGPLTPPRTAAELLDEILPRLHSRKSTDATGSWHPKSTNLDMGETI